MKLTSGVMRRERQDRALDRLLAQDTIHRSDQWLARHDREIETLKQRVGRF